MSTFPDGVAFPTLSPAELERVEAYGTVRNVTGGDLLFAPGDAGYDFFVIIDATVAIVHRATTGEHVIATHGAGRFIGELGLLTGARPILTARVEQSGRVIQVPVAAFRRLLDTETDLSRTIVDAFIARRALLQQGEGARTLQTRRSRRDHVALPHRPYRRPSARGAPAADADRRFARRRRARRG